MTAVAIAALPGGGPGQARPRRPDARRPPIPYRDGEPRAALRVTVEAPWGARSRSRRRTCRSCRGGAGGSSPRSAASRAAVRTATVAAVLLGDLNLPPRVVEPALRRSGWRTLPAGPTFPSWSPVAQLDHVLVRGGS